MASMETREHGQLSNQGPLTQAQAHCGMSTALPFKCAELRAIEFCVWVFASLHRTRRQNCFGLIDLVSEKAQQSGLGSESGKGNSSPTGKRISFAACGGSRAGSPLLVRAEGEEERAASAPVLLAGGGAEVQRPRPKHLAPDAS